MRVRVKLQAILMTFALGCNCLSGGFGRRPAKKKQQTKRKDNSISSLLQQRHPKKLTLLPPLSAETIASLRRNVPEDLDVSLSEHAQRLHGVNIDFAADNVYIQHFDPLVLTIDGFLSDEECDNLIRSSEDAKNSEVMQVASQTIDKDSMSKAARQSTTYYHKNAKDFVSAASMLLGVNSSHFEEPQTVKYESEKGDNFQPHIDALDPTSKLGAVEEGGQRIATLLCYLKDVSGEGVTGGGTTFRDLGVSIQPQKGKALLFFPSLISADERLVDIRTIHSGDAIVSADSSVVKWISQLWVREFNYSSKIFRGTSNE